MILLSLLTVALLVAVHLFSVRLRFLEMFGRDCWLAFAGGISAAPVVFRITVKPMNHLGKNREPEW